ncbi:unnamed protein product [Rangifer tarandus platyrhynchus]|uniref:Uncharacterized protein n=1 Tax=Rangifer tarandus platyrhynchus TaxID=3082113 RepID=A0AC60A4A2_RANTA
MGSQQESWAVACGDGPGGAAGSPVEQVSRSCQGGRHGAGGADPGGQGRAAEWTALRADHPPQPGSRWRHQSGCNYSEVRLLSSHTHGLLLLQSTAVTRASEVVAHGLSCPAGGIFPDQGSNPCPLRWQADS